LIFKQTNKKTLLKADAVGRRRHHFRWRYQFLNLWPDSISRPKSSQPETWPLDHIAWPAFRGNMATQFFVISLYFFGNQHRIWPRRHINRLAEIGWLGFSDILIFYTVYGRRVKA
jgi:hypothetical protein